MAPSPIPQGDPPQRPSEVNAPVRPESHLVWPWVFAALIILGLLAYGAWYLHSQYKARRLGLPPPSLFPFAGRGRSNANQRATSRSGVMNWVQNKFNAGSKSGYTGTGVRRGRGFGGLDPDEAWDTSVGTEADYGYGPAYGEEQELGVTSPDGPNAALQGRGYGPVGGLAAVEPQDGRERSRAREHLEERYNEEMHGQSGQGGRVQNPFGEGAERSSMRGVSPRPVHAEQVESPTERKSLFIEDV